MTQTNTTNSSRTGAWTLGVVLLAVGFAMFGIWTGVRQLPGPDDAIAPANAKGGQAATGSAMRSDSNLEDVRRSTFSFYVPHVEGEPPPNDKCPSYRDVTAKLTTTVSADTSLVLASDLHVELSGVTPPNPPLRDKLQRPEGERSFGSCFISTDTHIKSINWADGKIEADLGVQWNPITGYQNQLVKFRNHDSALVIDVCEPHPEWANGV